MNDRKLITLAFDWIGPLGFWPNGLSLDYYYAKNNYEPSTYSTGNKKNLYDLESRRHPFTFSKLKYVLGIDYRLQYKHISEIVDEKYIYELTPLLKPYQWINNCFANVSSIVKKDNAIGKNIIVINDMNEGYGNTANAFFQNLHHEIESEKLNANNIIYISMNSVLGDLYDSWCIHNDVKNPIKILDVYIYEHYYETVKSSKTKHFISLNRSPNPQRHAFVYELWRRDLIKYGHVSFPHKDEILDYKISKADIELFGLDASRWEEFLDNLPFTVDTADFTKQDCYNKPIHEYYSESYFAVISEQTFDDAECIKFSEKTFMALNNGCLPIYMYTPYTVKTLSEKLGYQTLFNDYDTVTDKKLRFKTLINTIEQICSLNLNSLYDITNSTKVANDHLFKHRVDNYSGLKKVTREIDLWLKS